MNDIGHLSAEDDACLASMAQFLAQILTIRDTTTENLSLNLVRDAESASRDRARQPRLITVMDEELRYVPTRQQVKVFEDLRSIWYHCIDCAEIADYLLDQACGASGGYVSVASIQNTAVYMSTVKEIALGPAHGTVRLGYIRGRIMRQLTDSVATWLLECDRIMCQAHNGPVLASGADACAFADLVDELAVSIALRLTAPHTSDATGSRLRLDLLDPKSLDARIQSILVLHGAQAEIDARNDLSVIHTLMQIAHHGTQSDFVVDVLQQTDFLDALQATLASDPPELAMSTTPHLGWTMLRRLATESSLYSRLRVAQDWIDHYVQDKASLTYVALAAAHKLLSGFQPLGGRRVEHVVVITSAHGDVTRPGIRLLPRPPFVPHNVSLALVAPPQGPVLRSGLPPMAHRMVRLLSLVWEFVANVALVQALLPSSMVYYAALTAQEEARVIAKIIDLGRRECEVGWRMYSFCDALADPSSEHAPVIDRAMCNLSCFSVATLMRLFGASTASTASQDASHTDGASIASVALRTRQLLGGGATPLVRPSYTRFAMDALRITLPIITARRASIGLHVTIPSNRLSDLVRTIPNVRQAWRQHGTFVVTLQMLAAAHPDTRAALQTCAERAPDSIFQCTPSGLPCVARRLRASTAQSQACSRSHSRICYGITPAALHTLLSS